jgi:predicted Fe-Mo cluster-binding NifX family protein
MKAAFAIWEGRMSPVFDVSREVLLLTVEDGSVVARERTSLETPTPDAKADRLAALGVDALVCGAISEPVHHELTRRGLEVIGFVAGEVEEVIASFLAGELPTPALSMPGCGCQRRCRGRGQGRDRGGGGGRGPGAGGGGRRRRRGS